MPLRLTNPPDPPANGVHPPVEYALYYASRGWQVFPIKPGTKDEPLCKWGAEATTDRSKISSWWARRPDANIGIATGSRSKLVVLDVDNGKGGAESLLALQVEYGKLPDTIESITGSGGRHILFEHPGVKILNQAGRLGVGLDIRGDGGYIVAPPSVHPNGKNYEWEPSSIPSKTQLAQMPGWLIDLTRDTHDTRTPNIVSGNGHIYDGQRNATLASMAGAMRRRGFDYSSILAALIAENEAKCQPMLEIQEVEQIAQSISRYDPAAPIKNMPKDDKSPIVYREPSSALDGINNFLTLLDNLHLRSIRTYIPRLDEAIGGIERQSLTILAARPSMGKSTLAFQIARNIANAGGKVLFYSLEMSEAALWAKAICGSAHERWKDIRAMALDGRIPDPLFERLSDHAARFINEYGDRILIDDGVNTTATLIPGIDKHRPDLVVVDHLRLLGDRGESETKRLGEISKKLKDIAKDFNCAVLCLAQLNRGVEARENKRPELSDLRDSGEIEENADVVLMLYRQDYYDTPGERPPNSLTEVLIRKFRDDIANRRILLNYNTSEQWFYDTPEPVMTF